MKPEIPVVFVLHAYQPFNQDEKILERIINNCYKPFFKKMEENSEVKINLNINGTLIDMLEKNYSELLLNIKKLLKQKQIELLGTGYYHPLLPLLDQEDIKAQIKLQNNRLKETFGCKPKYFFPPELAISNELLNCLSELGFEVTLSPENAFTSGLVRKYQSEKGSIFLVKRNKGISNGISFNAYKANLDHVINDLKNVWNLKKFPIVLAMDLETYGEHLPNYYNFFFELTKQVQTMTLSQTIKKYPIEESINQITPSSWSTSDEDLKKGIYYPLWAHPHNPFHQLQNLHLNLLYQTKVILKQEQPQKWKKTSRDYYAAQYSCQFWWASSWWSGEIIIKGIDYQRKTLEKMTKHINENFSNFILKLSDTIIFKLKQAVQTKKILR